MLDTQDESHVSSQVRELIDKVRAVFVETLDELGWMDEASKKKAQEKVRRWLEPHGQGILPGEGSPSTGTQGDRRRTRFRDEDTGSGCGLLRGGTRSQVWETLPAPLRTSRGGLGASPLWARMSSGNRPTAPSPRPI